MKKIVLSLLLLILVSSCNNSTTDSSKNQFSDFAGTHWVLKRVHFKDGTIKSINEIVGADESSAINSFYLHFTTDSQIRGLSGCNAVKYEYKLDGNNIQLDFYGVMTMVYCEFTDKFPAVLGHKTTYFATENTLIINSDYEEYSGLEFERAKEFEFKSENLRNTKWKLYQVFPDENTEVQFKFGVNEDGTRTDLLNYEIEFLPDGKIKGLANCNTFDGKYDLNNVQMKISPDNVTEMGCLYSDEYLKVLDKTTYIYMTENHLILYSNETGYKGLGFHRAD